MIELLCWIENHPGLAAWMQAIGSILAITVAIGVPYYQLRLQVKSNEAIRAEEIESLKAILIAEISHCIEFLNHQVKGFGAKLTPEMLMLAIPPSTKIFESNCGRLGLLKPEVTQDVLRFYQKIDALRIFTNGGNALPFKDFEAQVKDRAKEAEKAIAALKGG